MWYDRQSFEGHGSIRQRGSVCSSWKYLIVLHFGGTKTVVGVTATTFLVCFVYRYFCRNQCPFLSRADPPVLPSLVIHFIPATHPSARSHRLHHLPFSLPCRRFPSPNHPGPDPLCSNSFHFSSRPHKVDAVQSWSS